MEAERSRLFDDHLVSGLQLVHPEKLGDPNSLSKDILVAGDICDNRITNTIMNFEEMLCTFRPGQTHLPTL